MKILQYLFLCTFVLLVYYLLTTQCSFFSVEKDGKEMIWQFPRFTTCCQTYQLKIIPYNFLIIGGFFKTFFLTCSFSPRYFFYPEMFSGAFDFPKALSPISWKVLTWCLRPNPSGSQDFLLHIKDDISHSSGGEHWREVVQKRKKNKAIPMFVYF